MHASTLMGIVNINDDSFSNDGTLDPHEALLQAQQHILDGADIIDIGAESARTNREAIAIEQEIQRLQGFLEGWPDMLAATGCGRGIPLSLNTWRPEVIEAILPTGHIDIVNDISGLPDTTNARLVAEANAARTDGQRTALLIMHSVGEPKVPHTHQLYDDIWATLTDFFTDKIALARSAGLDDTDIILDPGIDFAKQRDDNLAIYRHLHRMHDFGLPVLVPVSRKTVIGDVLNLPNAADRDAGTIACLAACERHGHHIYRVHNTKAARQALDILDAIAGAK